MTYLLDTHYMLWAIADTKKLSRAIKDIITNPDYRIVVSAISFWEVSLKTSIGKLEITGFLSEDLPGICLKLGFEIESLSAADSCTYHKLADPHHRDPFNRMLIWQAIQNNYTLISSDSHIKKYASAGLKVLTGG
jgi:PIN domain nuclease of toxin-antitoxin system